MEYLAANLIGGVVWVLFFSFSQLKRQIFLTSLFGLPLAFFDLFMIPHYWQPQTFLNLPIGVEGFIFSFEMAGVVYAVGKIFDRQKSRNMAFSLKSVIPSATLLMTFLLLNVLLVTNPIISLYLALIVAILLTKFLRNVSLFTMLKTGFCFSAIYTVSLFIWVSIFPTVNTWFTLTNLPKVFVLGVPIYEPLFAFMFGMFWYENIKNYEHS